MNPRITGCVILSNGGTMLGRRMMIERLLLFARPFSSVALMVFSTKGVPDDEVEVPVHYCNNQHLHRDSALCKMY